jgi:hypothetical protein
MNLFHSLHPSFKALLSSNGQQSSRWSAFIDRNGEFSSPEKVMIVDLRCVVIAKTGRKWRGGIRSKGLTVLPPLLQAEAAKIEPEVCFVPKSENVFFSHLRPHVGDPRVV